MAAMLSCPDSPLPTGEVQISSHRRWRRSDRRSNVATAAKLSKMRVPTPNKMAAGCAISVSGVLAVIGHE